jgi:hypothetical protein
MPPDARELAQGLRGRTIHTIDRQLPNEVLEVVSADVIIATRKSPAGKPVALRYIQDGLDILYSDGRVRITPATFGGYRRSSFIGALLATLPGVRTTARPVWVELDVNGSTREPGDDAFRGYPDPTTSTAVDEAGIAVALVAIAARFPDLEVVSMSHTNPGFDVRVRDAEGVSVAYIEIKSTTDPAPVFFLSEEQRRFAEQFADRYHLLVVTSVDPARGGGDVVWHDGALDADRVELGPRQWRGRLRETTR